MLQKLLAFVRRNVRRQVVVISFFSILTFLVCFNYYFSFKVVDTANSIDGSWQYTLSSLRHSAQSLGVDVFFNYGPLFERSVAYVHDSDSLRNFLSSNLLLAAIFLLCCISIVVFIKHWVPPGKRGYAYVAAVLSYVLLTINQIDTLFFLVALTGLLAIRREPRLWVQTPILLGLQLFSFYKFSLSLYLLILTPVALFISFKKPDILRSLRRWLLFMTMYFLSYLAMTGDLSLGFVRYIYYGTINSLYYNEFMSLPFAQNKWLLLLVTGVAATTVILLSGAIIRALLVKKNTLRWDIVASLLLVLATSLILFKHAAIRNDGHLLAFSPILLLPLLAAATAMTQNKAMAGKRLYSWFAQSSYRTVIMIFMIWLAALGFHWYAVAYFTHKGPADTSNTQLKQFAPSIADNRLDYPYFKKQTGFAEQAIQKRAPEVVTINKQLELLNEGKELLFYGNTTMFGSLLDDRYDIKYAPFLQHYSAHPPKLFDDLYIDFLRKHPDVLLFAEENEPSIDKRIPAHELNDFFQYIRFNYRPIASDPIKRQYVLQRTSDKQATCKPYKTAGSAKAAITAIPSPHLSSNQYLKMKIVFPFDPVEKAVSSAVKSPTYSLHLRTPEGVVMAMRTTQSTLEHGIAVNPLYMSLHDAVVDEPFRLGSIVLHGGFDKNTQYEAQFELCNFR